MSVHIPADSKYRVRFKKSICDPTVRKFETSVFPPQAQSTTGAFALLFSSHQPPTLNA